MLRSFFAILLLIVVPAGSCAQEVSNAFLPGTKQLELTGDIASVLVDGADKFLMRELDSSAARRTSVWKQHFLGVNVFAHQRKIFREQLKQMLGIRDPRVSDTEPRILSTLSRPGLIGRGAGYEIFAVSWPSFGDVHGRGIMFVPTDRKPIANIVAVPDCNLLPEQIAGLVEGVEPESQFARRLAESGCQVIVPLLINRQERVAGIDNREWLYRSAYEMGRGLIGYEVQIVLASVDWFKRDWPDVNVGVIGWGEGGLLSLYAGAVDQRIDAVCVSGYFDSREKIWSEPIDRNVFGLLEKFGDAELAALIAPRSLIIEACRRQKQSSPVGAAPAIVETPDVNRIRLETSRATELAKLTKVESAISLLESESGRGKYGTQESLDALMAALSSGEKTVENGKPPVLLRNHLDFVSRHQIQMHEYDRHTQFLLRESHYLRQTETLGKFDFSLLETFEASAEKNRTVFYDEVIGRFNNKMLPSNPRTRQVSESEKWICYEVVLDVFPDVIAYGILLVPKDIRSGERRPVVVCQHGLEGRPQMTIGEDGFRSYSAFTAKLADRGFVTFAPQNLYIFGDRFRTLQRKANPLKKTLFSIITPQHQQIVDWLQTLEFIDPDRIGFYGLSYGGKTAMRVPALVTDYSLSICSGDFNEWVDKNASTRNPRSYVTTGEYEIFEFDLGSTYNYAEMAALIAPRPFMVERGHFDGVADDWTVAYEYAKVRHLYAAQLGIADNTEIEWFVGPHTVNGVGTFEFLHRHLNWPRPNNELIPNK